MGTELSSRARTAWKVQQGKSPWMPEPWSRERPLSPAAAPQGPAEPRDQRPQGQSSAPPPPSCPGDKATCAQRCPGRGCGPGAAGGGSEGPLPMAGALGVSGAGGRGAGAGGAAAVSGLERLCRAQAAPGGLLSREKGGGSGAKPREGLPSAWEVPAQLCGFFPPPRRQSGAKSAAPCSSQTLKHRWPYLIPASFPMERLLQPPIRPHPSQPRAQGIPKSRPEPRPHRRLPGLAGAEPTEAPKAPLGP